MKAVIVDLQGESAAALCEDGTFREVPDKGYSLGQTIEMQVSPANPAEYSEETEKVSGIHVKPSVVSGTLPTVGSTAAGTRVSGTVKKRYAMRLRWIGAAAAACFMCLSISAGTVWAIPYGKVQVANGSSLSYTINRFDYVLDVNAENEPGKQLLDELDMKKIVNRKIDRAVEETIGQMENLAGEAEDVKKAASDGSREIEIITDINNERHARTIQDRLEKIVSSAVNNADPANNTEEMPAGSQHVKGSSSNLSEEDRSKEDRLEENRKEEYPGRENKINDPEREEERDDQSSAQRNGEMSPLSDQGVEIHTDIPGEAPEADPLDSRGSDSAQQDSRNTENLTAPKNDDIPNNLSQESSSFKQTIDQDFLREGQEETEKPEEMEEPEKLEETEKPEKMNETEQPEEMKGPEKLEEMKETEKPEKMEEPGDRSDGGNIPSDCNRSFDGVGDDNPDCSGREKSPGGAPGRQ